ncbi:MAG: hypothetical protein ACOCV1_03685 [Bacillota bacterium]
MIKIPSLKEIQKNQKIFIKRGAPQECRLINVKKTKECSNLGQTCIPPTTVNECPSVVNTVTFQTFCLINTTLEDPVTMTLVADCQCDEDTGGPESPARCRTFIVQACEVCDPDIFN